MPGPDPLRDIELLVRSRHGLLLIETVDEERVASLLRHVADRLGVAFFSWSRARGLRRDGADNAVYGTEDFAQLCAHVRGARVPALYLLQGVGSLLGDELHSEQLAEAATQVASADGAVILVGEELALHGPAQRMVVRVELPGPSPAELETLIERLVRDIGQRMDVRVTLEPREARMLVDSLRGLTLFEAEKVLTRAIVEDGVLSPDDMAHVVAAKKQVVEREGVLEYYPVEESLEDIADLAGLKDWLAKRRNIIADRTRATEFGLSFPKGILLIGVPGCGKSLCARAVATEWRLPLLRLDPGALYNKYVGESERNFRRACALAERLAPVILFIDELEKAFATGSSEDGGVSQRVLGSFLAWLQDRRADVFTVATANDVSRLPAEFLRKGRFDEVFFVDLPDALARREILAIHLRRRNRDPSDFDVAGLAERLDGFSGAEIEQVVVAALYTAFSAGEPLADELLRREADGTRPLSVTMAERITALRTWAAGRTVPAN
jgi:SpoVK/Ycf46/Vps4 family AAA+-type ATPase